MENKLAVINPKASNQLSEGAFLKQNLDNTKIMNIHDVELKKTHIALFVYELELHFAPDKKTEALIMQDIEKMILSVFKTLTINELYYAGQLKRYGEIGAGNKAYGRITTEFVSQLLVDYKNWKRETLKNHNLPIAKKEPEIIMPDAEKVRLIWNGLNTCFDYFIKNNEIPLGYIWVYDHLADVGIINYTPEEKKAVMPIALAKVKTDIKNSNNRALYKGFLKQLEAGVNKNTVVINKAKEILLERYFLKLQTDKKHLKDVL